MDLPSYVKAGLEQRLHGVSRRDLARRAARLTFAYRQGGASQAVVRTAEDALSYAVARMPATYAATAAALAQAAPRLAGLEPTSLLDLGSGPGTASFAALAQWPHIAHVTMVERHAAFRALARSLAQASDIPALSAATLVADSLTAAALNLPAADLVVAAYLMVELDAAAVPAFVRTAFARSRGALVLVEPGTPAGFARIRAARDKLIQLGASPIAPCPHARPCPIVSPDWCHFSVRLARSRDHKLAKSADAPFEDEKFSYLAVDCRAAVAEAGERIIARPSASKGEIALRLCTSDGIIEHRVSRRDKVAWKSASRLDWGDLMPTEHETPKP